MSPIVLGDLLVRGIHFEELGLAFEIGAGILVAFHIAFLHDKVRFQQWSDGVIYIQRFE